MCVQRATAVAVLMMVGLYPAAANEIRLVSPPGLENVDGNLSGEDSNAPLRAQRLHLASEFASLTVPHFITGIALRADKDQQTTVTGETSQFELYLSTTGVSDLDAKYADNLGADNQLVFSGPISLEYPATGPPEGPQPFGTAITFEEPYFLYDPSKGNLLVDTFSTVESTGSEGFLFDLEDSPGHVSFIGGDPNLDMAQGLRRTQLVTQFTMIPVPEPCTTLLALLGFVFVGWMRRQR